MEPEVFLRNQLRQGTMETAKFGDCFLTYLRCKDSDRLVSLERYPDEMAAREGHLRWVRKEWHRKSLKELLREDG